MGLVFGFISSWSITTNDSIRLVSLLLNLNVESVTNKDSCWIFGSSVELDVLHSDFRSNGLGFSVLKYNL